MIDIANRIALLRKEKNMTQAELAKMVDASREIISKYEKDGVMPSIEMAKKIADAFGVTLDYLVGEGSNSKFDKKTLKRINDIEAMDNEFKAQLFNIMDAVIRDYKTRQMHK
jgi:transcriptional regulator with XRE-family HTH domain